MATNGSGTESKRLKGKIYSVWVGDKQILIKARTKQGAITHAAEKMIHCEYADQNTLYAASKAGVEIIDLLADPNQPLLPGVDPMEGGKPVTSLDP